MDMLNMVCNEVLVFKAIEIHLLFIVKNCERLKVLFKIIGMK